MPDQTDDQTNNQTEPVAPVDHGPASEPHPAHSVYQDSHEAPVLIEDQAGREPWWRGFLGIAELVGAALLLAFFFSHFIFHSYQVFGQSMQPTLHEGDRLIISKVGRSWASLLNDPYIPKRGEIIVFDSPLSEETQLIKRVIGLPGERVVVKNGDIRVYNDARPEGFDPDTSFTANLPDYTTGNVDIKLDNDEIFVSGDNRVPGGSLDSRNDLGAVPLEKVIGKLVFRLFPVTDIENF